MAKESKKETTETTNKTETSWSKMSLKELKAEYERLSMDIKLGKEANTSLARKLKRLIAKEMTKINLNKKN